jgi:hypothetical protein
MGAWCCHSTNGESPEAESYLPEGVGWEGRLLPTPELAYSLDYIPRVFDGYGRWSHVR